MPPPGWFPDPADSTLWRWWDGRVWTEHIGPRGQAGQTQGAGAHDGRRPPLVQLTPQTSAATTKPWYFRWWAIAAAVLLGLLITGSLLPSDETVPTAASAEGRPDGGVGAGSSSGPTEDVEPAPVDTDGDGVVDDEDYRPTDPSIQARSDVDTDSDGVPDFRDAFPRNGQYSKDSDGDRVADRLDDFPNDADYSKDRDGDRVADAVDAFPNDPRRSEITLAMENALARAQDYLNFSPFSRQGLVDQMTSEYGSGFELADATWAVDQLHVNWKKQAVRAARDYLDFTAFSRQGLIDQLSSPYGAQFTLEEATYAVNKIGL